MAMFKIYFHIWLLGGFYMCTLYQKTQISPKHNLTQNSMLLCPDTFELCILDQLYRLYREKLLRRLVIEDPRKRRHNSNHAEFLKITTLQRVRRKNSVIRRPQHCLIFSDHSVSMEGRMPRALAGREWTQGGVGQKFLEVH